MKIPSGIFRRPTIIKLSKQSEPSVQKGTNLKNGNLYYISKYTMLRLYEYLFNLGTKNITYINLNNKNIYKNFK